jgi:hypothetical protein
MFCAVSAARDICVSFGFSFRADISGRLIFDYNSGPSERFGKDGHLIPISAGFWCSRMVDLNIIREVFICLSAMDAIAFLHFNAARFSRSDELLFMAFTPGRNYPKEVFKELRKVKINLLLGNDLLDVLQTIRFCMDHKSIKVHFILEDELVVFRFTERVFFISQHRLSLRQFFCRPRSGRFLDNMFPNQKFLFYMIF